MQVAAIKSNVAVTMGMIGGFDAQIMLDSGSSVSLIRKEILHKAQGIDRIQSDDPPMQLVTASGDELPVLEYVRAPVVLGDFKFVHKFVVVENLVSPVILGVDFLQNNAIVLDFGKVPVKVSKANVSV